MKATCRALPVSLCWLLFSLLLFPAPAEANKQDDFVLVIHSYNPSYSWTSRIQNAIETEFANSGLAPELYAEYMGTNHLPMDQGYLELLEKVYEYKYRARQPKLVVAVDNNALDFLLPIRQKLFPRVPLVFCGINHFNPEILKGQSSVTGVIEQVNWRETIDAALKLQPSVDDVVVVSGGGSMIFDENALKFRAAAAWFNGRARFRYWLDSSLMDLPEKLGELRPNTLIMMIGPIRDNGGRLMGLVESLAPLRNFSPVPIYSFWDILLGNGILGGVLADAGEQGTMAAKLALRILRGEKAENIPVIAGRNKLKFDFDELARFGIGLGSLPKESYLINTPSSFYSLNKFFVWAAGVIFACLVSLALGLVMNLRSRLKAEAALSEAKAQLAIRVEERTKELSKANTTLREEVSERRQVEAALRRSEERFRTIYENSPAMIAGYDAQGKVILWNRALEKSLGWSQEEARVEDDILVKCYPDINYYRMVRKTVEKADGKFRQFSPRTKDGSIKIHIWANFALPDGAIISVGYDDTERKSSEEIKLEGEKLKAAVETAGAACHELNQPLQVIQARLEILSYSLPQDHPLRDEIKIVMGEIQRMAEMTGRLQRITKFKTKAYMEGVEILDLDGSTE